MTPALGSSHPVARAVAAAGFLAVLAACGEGEVDGPGADGPPRTEDTLSTGSPEPDSGSLDPRAKVSEDATCEQLFSEGSNHPIQRVLALVRGGQVGREVLAAASHGADALRAAAEGSPAELEAQLVLVADEADARIAELRRGGSIDTDRTAFMAAGLQVVRACEPTGNQGSAASAPTSQPAARTTIPGDGTLLVGQDVVAGTYRSSGPSRDDGTECVAYASSEAGDINTFLRGSTSTGPAFLVLNAGEYVTTMFCRPFNIQG